MANSKKKLYEAAIKFRKENSAKHSFYLRLIDSMAEFIKKSGVAEATVGFKNGEYYECANH